LTSRPIINEEGSSYICIKNNATYYIYQIFRQALRELIEKPHAGKQLKGKLKGLLSWRVGRYRILYQIQEEKLLVFAISVSHRKHVYD
jgi:mRNA-degrading endonuclease RelE of RelBE toxin-antitoxin system